MAAEGGFGPAKDTGAGEIVTILLTGSDPHALKLQPDRDGCAASIVSFERANGKFGTIQRHGGVHPGDILFGINDSNLENMPHGDVLLLLNDRNLLRKNLKFMSSNEYYRRKKKNMTTMGRGDAASSVSRQSFVSKVKRARVVDVGAGSSSKYAEYEITCQWKVVAGLEKEKTMQWSVWKRFSEFESLHGQLKKSLGWQIDHVEFPPSHSLTMNKYTPEFIERRRDALNTYWQGICAVAKVVEFDKHHCSPDLKKFLDVDSASALSEQPQPTNSAADDADGAAAGGRTAPARRMSQKSMSSRRLSSKTVGAALNYEEGGSSGAITSTPKGTASSSSAASRGSGQSSPAPTGGALAASAAPAPAPAAAAAPPPAPTMAMSAVLSENLGKYTKMKSMLPEGAVRQRMSADGCLDKEIDEFFGGGGGGGPPAAPAAPAAAAVPRAAPAAPAVAPAAAAPAPAPPSKSPPPPAKSAGRANLLASINARRVD